MNFHRVSHKKSVWTIEIFIDWRQVGTSISNMTVPNSTPITANDQQESSTPLETTMPPNALTSQQLAMAYQMLGLPAGPYPAFQVPPPNVEAKPSRSRWEPRFVEWVLQAFGKAKADERYDVMLPSDWKSKENLIKEDLDKIKQEHDDYPWIAVKPVKTKWNTLRAAYTQAKRAQLLHTGGGEMEEIENEELFKNIIPDTHATVTPAQLVQSGQGVVSVTDNAVAQELEKQTNNTGRARREAEDRELKKRIKLICDKELESNSSGSVANDQLAKVQERANLLKAMELTKGMSVTDIEAMKTNANLLFE